MNKRNKKVVTVAITITALVLIVVGYGFYKNNKLKEANKQVNNLDSKQTEQKQVEKKQTQEVIKDNTTKNIVDSKLDKKAATEIISNYIKSKYPEAKCVYDHNQKRDGKEYYVIHVFGSMQDNSSTATIGWYYVEVDTGKAFQWDLINDKLDPIN